MQEELYLVVLFEANSRPTRYGMHTIMQVSHKLTVRAIVGCCVLLQLLAAIAGACPHHTPHCTPDTDYAAATEPQRRLPEYSNPRSELGSCDSAG